MEADVWKQMLKPGREEEIKAVRSFYMRKYNQMWREHKNELIKFQGRCIDKHFRIKYKTTESGEEEVWFLIGCHRSTSKYPGT